MTEYLKHVYTGRIYQIMRDHGPDHPYLWSPWEFSVRTPSKERMDRFFKPTEKPPIMPTRYDISILEEMAWEDRRILGSKPIVVEAPKPTVKKTPRPRTRTKAPATPQGGFTIQDLALELGCSPGQARAVLRKSKLEKPSRGWRWSSSEEAEPYRKAVKKGLK